MMNFGQIIHEGLKNKGQKIYFQENFNFENKLHTFKEVNENIINFAFGLLKIGIKKDYKFIFLTQSNIHAYQIQFALGYLGIEMINLDERISENQMAQIINQYNEIILFIDNQEFFDTILPHLNNVKKIKSIISVEQISESNKKKIRNLIFYYTTSQLLAFGNEDKFNHPDKINASINQIKPNDLILTFFIYHKGSYKKYTFDHKALITGINNLESYFEKSFLNTEKFLNLFPFWHPISKILVFICHKVGHQFLIINSNYNIQDLIYLKNFNLNPSIIVTPNHLYQSMHSFLEKQLNINSPVLDQIYEHEFSQILKSKIPKYLIKTKNIFMQNLSSHYLKNTFLNKVKFIFCFKDNFKDHNFQNIEVNYFKKTNIQTIYGLILPHILSPITLNPIKHNHYDTLGTPLGDIEIENESKQNFIKIRTNASMVRDSKSKNSHILYPINLKLLSNGHYQINNPKKAAR